MQEGISTPWPSSPMEFMNPKEVRKWPDTFGNAVMSQRQAFRPSRWHPLHELLFELEDEQAWVDDPRHLFILVYFI